MRRAAQQQAGEVDLPENIDDRVDAGLDHGGAMFGVPGEVDGGVHLLVQPADLEVGPEDGLHALVIEGVWAVNNHALLGLEGQQSILEEAVVGGKAVVQGVPGLRCRYLRVGPQLLAHGEGPVTGIGRLRPQAPAAGHHGPVQADGGNPLELWDNFRAGGIRRERRCRHSKGRARIKAVEEVERPFDLALVLPAQAQRAVVQGMGRQIGLRLADSRYFFRRKQGPALIRSGQAIRNFGDMIRNNPLLY